MSYLNIIRLVAILLITSTLYSANIFDSYLPGIKDEILKLTLHIESLFQYIDVTVNSVIEEYFKK